MLVAGEGTAARLAIIAFWYAPAGPLLLATGLLLVYLGIVWSTIRWLDRADTWQILD